MDRIKHQINAAERPPNDGGFPSIGWYVHLPFCTTKCGYCDFYSLPSIPHLVDHLVQALNAEMAARDPRRHVESVFIGGGTPTVLPIDALAAVLDSVASRTAPVIEFTVEANPSSTDELKLDLLKSRGVNRISFGAQSFDTEDLAVLQRLHNPRHIVNSVTAARAAGFDNINLDLIYAVPGQTLERWRDSLRRAVDLGTEHLSCYALMYEPGTQLTQLRRGGRIVACDEDLEADMFELTIDELAAAGFEHYEVSNFARPGRRCRANLTYWQNLEYLGIGPSAVSYLNGTRQKNVPDIRKYIEGMRSDPESIVIEREKLVSFDRACETAVQMLRLTEGIQFDSFHHLTGFDAAVVFANQIRCYRKAGLMHVTPDAFCLTRRGMLLANRIMSDFLSENESVAARS